MKEHIFIFPLLLSVFAVSLDVRAATQPCIITDQPLNITITTGDPYDPTRVPKEFGKSLSSDFYYLRYDGAWTSITAPQRIGKKLDGWYTLSADSDPSDIALAKLTERLKESDTFTKDDLEDARTTSWTGTYGVIGPKYSYKELKIEFDGNGATSGSTAAQGGLNYNSENIVLNANGYVRTGYTFANWTTAAGKSFTDGATVQGSDFWVGGDDGSFDSKLYANWTENTYTIGSSGENCTVTVNASGTFDKDLAISWNPDGNWTKPTVTVYAGTESKGTPIKVFSNLDEGTRSTTFRMSDLGAYYENIFIRVSYDVHTLTFNANGGSCDEEFRRVEDGKSVGALPIPTMHQKQYDGWWDDQAHGIQITQTTKLTEDITVYAHWADVTLFQIDTLADPAEGGSLTGGGSFEKDAQTILTATPSNGYSFVKWAAKTSGEERFDASWPITVGGGEEYTAVFTGNVYKVTFMLVDHEGNVPDPMMVTYGSPFGPLPAATLDDPDYQFDHWMDEDDDPVTEETIVRMSSKYNYLYAHISRRPAYQVAYVGGADATGEMPSQKFYCGVATNLAANAFAKAGCVFMGWATNAIEAAQSKVSFADGARIESDLAADGESVTLYAVWRELTLSEAMHCTNLVWTSDKTTGTEAWQVMAGDGCGFEGSGSCVSHAGAANVANRQYLTTTFTTNGHLSFLWKGTFIGVKVGTAAIQWYQSAETWNAFEVDIEGCEDAPVKIEIRNYGNIGESADIDQMTWTPGGLPPGPENAVTISSATVSDGKFILSFPSDERFDYNLLTNANLLINSWGVMTNEVGTGETITFEPEIIEGQPQMFYRVDTIRRQDR